MDLSPESSEKLPLLSLQPKRGEMGILRLLKQELKAGGYPLAETKQVFEEFYQSVKARLLRSIPENSSLVIMPSTSGRNQLPVLLAQALGVRVHNQTFEEIKPLFSLEGKNKGNFLTRLEDPIRFQLQPQLIQTLQAAHRSGSPVILIDDIVSGGEQMRALTLQLRKEGIPVAGLAALRASSLQYPTESALKQTLDKIEPFLEKDQKERFQRDFREYFAPFPRTKLARFDQALNELTDWGKVQQVIRTGAQHLRQLEGKENLPEKQTLEQKQEPAVKPSRKIR
jgi:hypothetical protein